MRTSLKSGVYVNFAAFLQEVWEEASNKPAWLHADSAVSHEGKAKLFKTSNLWKVEANEAQPKCKTWGRKLGDRDFETSEAKSLPMEDPNLL